MATNTTKPRFLGNNRRSSQNNFDSNVYNVSLITKQIVLPIKAININLTETLESTIASMIGGKCIVEGFVKPKSVKLITYSSGLIKGDSAIFDVVFECLVCFPVANMYLNCVAKNITKAGIRGELASDNPGEVTPFVLFVNRDHYYSNNYFNSIKVGDKFIGRVIAQRFELNDKYVSVVADLVPPGREITNNRPKIHIEDSDAPAAMTITNDDDE